MKITREDFDHWLASPVTEAVREAAKVTADEAKQKWIEASWGARRCDPVELAELKGAAQIAEDFAAFEWTDLPEEMRDDDGKQIGHLSD